MRRTAFTFIVGMLLIALTGSRWDQFWTQYVGDPPPLLGSVVTYIDAIEQWMRNWVSYPALFSLAIILFAVIALWPQIKATLSRQEQEKSAFYNDFHGYTADHRERIRMFAAEEWGSGLQKLADFVRSVELPPTLPLPSDGNLLSWVQEKAETEFTDAAARLYKFAKKFYPPHEPLPRNTDLNESRRIAAKFWDRIGRRIRDGHLKIDDQLLSTLKTQADDLVMICFLEIAQTEQSGWDVGAGKRGLFYLARRVRELVDGAR